MIYRRTNDEVEGPESEEALDDLDRLRMENQRLAISLGAFSAFIASRGLLEEAWDFIHNVYELDQGTAED